MVEHIILDQIFEIEKWTALLPHVASQKSEIRNNFCDQNYCWNVSYWSLNWNITLFSSSFYDLIWKIHFLRRYVHLLTKFENCSILHWRSRISSSVYYSKTTFIIKSVKMSHKVRIKWYKVTKKQRHSCWGQKAILDFRRGEQIPLPLRKIGLNNNWIKKYYVFDIVSKQSKINR